MTTSPAWPEGSIAVDSPIGEEIGFTSDRFHTGSWLWYCEGEMIVSYIVAVEQGKGYFREMVERILALGIPVVVPTPLPKMLRILVKNGYRHEKRTDPLIGEEADVWTMHPKDHQRPTAAG